MSPILIAGEVFDLSSLKAVFSDDSAAIDACGRGQEGGSNRPC